jgi:hypothetical protein
VALRKLLRRATAKSNCCFSVEDGLPELPLFLTARSHWVVFARVWSGVIESIAGGNHPIVI